MIDILGGISNPLTEAAAAGAVGLAALAFRRWRTGSAIIVVAAAWAYLCATPAFAFLLWQGLANQYPPKPPADYPRADAIVLVGGGPVPRQLSRWNANTRPSLSTPPGMALALYQAGKAATLAATSNYARAPLVDALARQGVPANAWRLRPLSQTTHDDAVDVMRVLMPGATILLVTTPSHMPRTVATFRKQGFEVIPAPALHPARIARLPRSWLLRRGTLYFSRSSLHEYIGLLFYRIRGWATW